MFLPAHAVLFVCLVPVMLSHEPQKSSYVDSKEDSFRGSIFQDAMKLSTFGHLYFKDLLHNVVLGVNEVFRGQYVFTCTMFLISEPFQIMFPSIQYANSYIIGQGQVLLKVVNIVVDVDVNVDFTSEFTCA